VCVCSSLRCKDVCVFFSQVQRCVGVCFSLRCKDVCGCVLPSGAKMGVCSSLRCKDVCVFFPQVQRCVFGIAKLLNCCVELHVAAHCKRHTRDIRLGVVFLYVLLHSSHPRVLASSKQGHYF
jgi:hypothetical protein